MPCVVLNCNRPVVYEDGEDLLCARHMPDPNVRSWGEMRAEGIEIETMEDYRRELTYVPDYDPSDPSDADYFREDY